MCSARYSARRLRACFFTKFIGMKNKRDLIGLTLWSQVQQCKLITDSETRQRSGATTRRALGGRERSQEPPR